MSKEKKIWVPKSEMEVTVDANGEMTMIEKMTMIEQQIHRPNGFGQGKSGN